VDQAKGAAEGTRPLTSGLDKRTRTSSARAPLPPAHERDDGDDGDGKRGGRVVPASAAKRTRGQRFKVAVLERPREAALANEPHERPAAQTIQ
jgi:hypothetical protein